MELNHTPALPSPLAKTSLVDQVQTAIKTLILDRRLGAGDPLPTELELTEVLGVSRNSIREALRVLQAQGIITVRRGRGMFVGTFSMGRLIEELTFHGRRARLAGERDLFNMLQVRELLEAGLIDQLVRSPAEIDRAAIADVLARMDAEAADGQFTPSADREFHQLLYQSLNNPLVSELLGAFWEVFNLLDGELPTPTVDPLANARIHRDILEAVTEGDPDRGRTAMIAHFQPLHDRLDQEITR